MIILLTKYSASALMKNHKMVGSYGTYEGEESCIRNFGGEICGKESTLNIWV